MKTVLQRMTRWYNLQNQRSGTLWEERYKSVIVQSGSASRMIAAYIDLNCLHSVHATRFLIFSSENECCSKLAMAS